ncbi:MAG: LysR family transcriptional regulator [Hyphomonadaceae bacterium]|nr:LysR family transcriptional regulator [Hyphomonadaceae bacterium]
MSLRRQDLNLLPILRELIRTESVSRAAENIHLSQSATSGALARLRSVFDDELLVMDGRNMVATPFAKSIQQKVEEACSVIEGLYQPGTFDPKTETRQFNIAATDYVAYVMGGHIARCMLERSDAISVRFHPIGRNLEQHLLYGDIDIAILSDRGAEHLNTTLQSQWLFRDERVVIASVDNPPFRGPLTLETYLASPHASFEMHQFDSVSMSQIWPEIERPARQVVSVPHFTALPETVANSGCLALVQKRLAMQMAAAGLVSIHPPPFDAPPVDIFAYRSPLRSHDPAVDWIMTLLVEVSAGLPDLPADRSAAPIPASAQAIGTRR